MADRPLNGDHEATLFGILVSGSAGIVLGAAAGGTRSLGRRDGSRG